jgi:hypothetical protein
MTWKTQGTSSATMRSGITPEYSRASLNALLVVCHGWLTPDRLPISFPSGRLYPNRVLSSGGIRYVVLERGEVPRLKLVLP